MNFSCKNVEIMSTYCAINEFKPILPTYVIALINPQGTWLQITKSNNLVGKTKIIFDYKKIENFSINDAIQIISDIKKNLGKFQTLMIHTLKDENKIGIPIVIALQEKFPHINFDINMLKQEMTDYEKSYIYQIMKKANSLV
jgi:hypothetical protein